MKTAKSKQTEKERRAAEKATCPFTRVNGYVVRVNPIALRALAVIHPDLNTDRAVYVAFDEGGDLADIWVGRIRGENIDRFCARATADDPKNGLLVNHWDGLTWSDALTALAEAAGWWWLSVLEGDLRAKMVDTRNHVPDSEALPDWWPS